MDLGLNNLKTIKCHKTYTNKHYLFVNLQLNCRIYYDVSLKIHLDISHLLQTVK